MPEKREKPIFRMSAENGQKGVRNGVLGEEKGKADAETAFSCKLDKYRIILIFNALCKNRRFFALKIFAFRLHLQTVLQTLTWLIIR